MTGTSSGNSQAEPGKQGRRRARQPVPRTRTVEFTLTGEEYAILVEAARREGITRRAYAAQAALAAAANGTTISSQDPLELMLIELMRAAGLVRHIADAAWATSDTLHVAAAMLGSRILAQAADAYDRAARSPYGRIPPPSPVGNRLRQAARLISAFAYLTQDRSIAPILLITKLAALAEAVAELRQSQQRAA